MPFLTQRRQELKQNAKMEEFIPVKEQDKAIANDLSETDPSNMPTGELKGTIIRILIGFEKKNRQQMFLNAKYFLVF